LDVADLKFYNINIQKLIFIIWQTFLILFSFDDKTLISKQTKLYIQIKVEEDLN
jgi:hypothetical protein